MITPALSLCYQKEHLDEESLTLCIQFYKTFSYQARNGSICLLVIEGQWAHMPKFLEIRIVVAQRVFW